MKDITISRESKYYRIFKWIWNLEKDANNFCILFWGILFSPFGIAGKCINLIAERKLVKSFINIKLWKVKLLTVFLLLINFVLYFFVYVLFYIGAFKTILVGSFLLATTIFFSFMVTCILYKDVTGKEVDLDRVAEIGSSISSKIGWVGSLVPQEPKKQIKNIVDVIKNYFWAIKNKTCPKIVIVD